MLWVQLWMQPMRVSALLRDNGEGGGQIYLAIWLVRMV
jgi:hypothetical protein